MRPTLCFHASIPAATVSGSDVIVDARAVHVRSPPGLDRPYGRPTRRARSSATSALETVTVTRPASPPPALGPPEHERQIVGRHGDAFGKDEAMPRGQGDDVL